jgi:hypothetical protein
MENIHWISRRKETRMKTTVRSMMALALGIGLAGFTFSCASTGSQSKPSTSAPQTGFLHGYYQNLQPGPEGGAKLRWIKPGANFGKYDKIMLDSVLFYFSDDSEDKRIDAQDMKELADACNLQVVNVLKGAYPIVASPGPDVLRLRFAITDLKQSRPLLSAASSVVPVGLGISILKKGATGSWTGSGATSAEFMALDAMTNDVIAVALDDKTAEFAERFTKWGSAEEAFEFWAERIKFFLDRAHGKKQ